MQIFSERLKALRKEKRLKQSEMALRLEISTRAYQNYETNVTVPLVETLIALADFFDVSTDYLLGRSGNPESHKKNFKKFDGALYVENIENE